MVVVVVVVVVAVVPAAAYFRSNHTHLVAQFLFSRIQSHSSLLYQIIRLRVCTCIHRCLVTKVYGSFDSTVGVLKVLWAVCLKHQLLS